MAVEIRAERAHSRMRNENQGRMPKFGIYSVPPPPPQLSEQTFCDPQAHVLFSHIVTCYITYNL